MNAIPPRLAPSPESAARPFAPGANGLSLTWAALQDAGAVVCALAGEDPERGVPEVRNYPAMVRDAGGWRARFAEQGIADLAALMEPGIAALLAVNARGLDATDAAQALWREFRAARAALLALVPPSGAMGPPRNA